MNRTPPRTSVRKQLFAGLLIACVPLLASFGLHAQTASTTIKEPSLRVFDVWAKTTVPGGSVSAVYMHIKSAKPLRLVKAESSAAATVEIHEMKMKDGVMEMKAVGAVEIPANKMVELKPGGFHIMLFKVTKAINKGDIVPLKLTFEATDKKIFTVDVSAKGQEKDSGSHKH